jgi:hypothetical protein
MDDIWLLDILTMMLQLHQIKFEDDYELRIGMTLSRQNLKKATTLKIKF